MQDDRIAFYGVDCAACIDCTAGKCPGCRHTVWTADNICMPVACCREREIACCGECPSFPCTDMEAFYQESDSHRLAFDRMRAVGSA